MQQTRLYFMLAFHNNSEAPNPVVAAAFTILKRKGFQIEIGFAESLLLQPEALSAKHDLSILKSHTSLWLSLAGVLHFQGAELLNPYLACLAAMNTIMTAWPVSPKLRRIALRCGQVSGLCLYGLDVVEGPEGPVVVELNYFPSYRDVPKAATLIADYIEDYTKEHCPRLAVNQFAQEAV